MKNLVFVLTLVSFLSCQEKDGLNNNQVDFSNMQLDLTGILSDGVVIGNLNDINSINSALSLLNKEVDLMREENPKIQTVTFMISESENNVFLDGYFTSTSEGTIVSSYGKIDSNVAASPVPIGYSGGGCPSGYTSLGSCSNFGDTSVCVGEILANYLGATLSSVGDCAETRVSVGMTSTNVCGKEC